jgi:hypothetical protein
MLRIVQLIAIVLLTASATTTTVWAKHLTTAILIHNVTELQNIQNNLSGNYQLANDIDASKSHNFAPIGGLSQPFGGSLDGNGYAISNLLINSTAREVGLFGAASGGSIRNLRIVNIKVVSSPTDSCYPRNFGDIFWYAPCATGGLIGLAWGETILSAYVQGAMSGNVGPTNNGGPLAMGSIVGVADGVSVTNTQSNVTVSGKLSGSAGEALGGLIGMLRNSPIGYSNALGAVTATEKSGATGDYVIAGGAIGSALCADGNGYHCTYALHSYATGAVTLGMVSTSSWAQAGGFVGNSNGNIDTAFASGNVQSSGDAGGFAEISYGAIQNAWASGTVTASGKGDAAGFAALIANGGDPSYLYEVYSTGRVTSKSGLAGGLVAKCSADCGGRYEYWDLETSGQATSATGIGLRTNQLKNGKLPDGFEPSVWMPVAFPIRLESIDSQILDYPKLWKLSFPITHFPLAGQSPYGSDTTSPPGAQIISVFDHSLKKSDKSDSGQLYVCDKIITAFDNLIGQQTFGHSDDTCDLGHHPGYQQNADGTPFVLKGVNYTGTNVIGDGTRLLEYEGHPGYDYRAYYEPVFAAVSGALFYPLEAVGMLSANHYHAYCFFHALAQVPDNSTTYRIYYLHLLTHPAGIDPYSPPCTGNGDTNGEVVTIQNGWIDPSCVYRDQGGAKFSPSSLPLPGGTHVEVPQGKLCVIAESGSAGVPGPHLHFEIQQIVPSAFYSADQQKKLSYFKCFNEDSYDVNNRDGKHLCLPTDSYGWTPLETADTNCPVGDPLHWTGDIWQCLTGIPSRRFWVQ